jgi:hypothetical protein
MRDLNDLAKAQGRFLDQAFGQIPRKPGSILDVPLTPEAEERIRHLVATIARLKRQRAAGQGPAQRLTFLEPAARDHAGPAGPDQEAASEAAGIKTRLPRSHSHQPGQPVPLTYASPSRRSE